jgi:hypothetical protein
MLAGKGSGIGFAITAPCNTANMKRAGSNMLLFIFHLLSNKDFAYAIPLLREQLKILKIYGRDPPIVYPYSRYLAF